MKISTRTSRLGNPAVAYLVGVAAAVAVGGAILGTIIPQTQASFNVMDVTNAGQNLVERLFFGILMLIGTITTLVYFHFGAKSTPTGPQRNKFVDYPGLGGADLHRHNPGCLIRGCIFCLLDRAH